MSRQRLPNRRQSLTEDITVAGRVFSATVGFDLQGRPKEIFLSGAREGSELQAILDDTAIILSIAMQHGIAARAMQLSISRLPLAVPGQPRAPASVIGSVLDWLAIHEIEGGI